MYLLFMLKRLEQRLRDFSDWNFVTLLGIILLARVGPSPIGKPWVGWVYDAARAFPKTTSYISYSPLPVLIAKVMREPRMIIWWSLFGVLLLVWILVVMDRLKVLFPKNYRIVQIIFAASQVVMLQSTFIGHYDNISVIAASLVFLWDSPILLLVGALLASGANAYMSFATGVCVLVLYLGTRSRRHLQIGIVYTLVSTFMLLGLHLFLQAPASGTRESIVLGQIGYVVKGAFGVWTFIILGVLGPLWFIYVWLMAQKEWSFGNVTLLRKFCVFMGTVGIPVGMSFFILDHTRIGVVVGALPLVLYLLPELQLFFVRYAHFVDGSFPVLSMALLVWVLYPAIIVDTSGVFRLPYAKFVAMISGG